MAAVTLFLALLLLLSAGQKIVQRTRMADATARLSGLASPLALTLSLGVAALEGGAAVALLIEDTRLVGAILAGLIWLSYGAALYRRIGERLDCGCNLAAREQPVGRAAVIRSVFLACLAAMAAFLPVGGVMVEAPFAALALLALYLAAGELAAIPAPAWKKA